MINKNSKNNELLENPKIKEAIKAGKVIVFDKANSSNPDFVTLYLAQEVKGIGTSLNSAQSFLLGFNNSGQIQRCIQNVSAENAEMIEIGDNINDLFDSDFSLQINDSLTANKDFKHKPRMGKNKKTEEMEILVCKETGKPIYRQAELVSSEEVSHTIIKTVLESQYAGKAVKREKLEMEA